MGDDATHGAGAGRSALAYTGDVSTEDLEALHGFPAAESRTPSRPGPVRWLWYALGGGLPARFSPWVLHDTTTRTWALRHVLRSFVQLSVPVTLVLLLVPGEFWIRGMAALGGVFLALFFSLAYMPETTESRVKRAGYPAGTAAATRERLGQERQAAESRRRREAAARRGARHRARHGR
jgi:hypothetical protein